MLVCPVKGVQTGCVGEKLSSKVAVRLMPERVNHVRDVRCGNCFVFLHLAGLIGQQAKGVA